MGHEESNPRQQGESSINQLIELLKFIKSLPIKYFYYSFIFG